VWNTGIQNPVPSRREFSRLADIPVGGGPLGLASQDRNKVYVANERTGTLSVITATDAVTYKLTATIGIGREPRGVAVSPDGSKLYVTFFDNVSVIDTATNDQNVIFDGGHRPVGVAVSSDGSKYYVANEGSDTVSAIATATNAVTATIPVGRQPFGVCHEHGIRRRLGDRHGDQYGHRDDPRRPLSQRRGGDPGRQQALCRERGIRQRLGNRHKDQYGDPDRR